MKSDYLNEVSVSFQNVLKEMSKSINKMKEPQKFYSQETINYILEKLHEAEMEYANLDTTREI